MRAITFHCDATLQHTPEEIARQILEVNNWLDFHGYGPIPGIKTATIELQTPQIVGTRIRVVNQDGSSHVEEIVEWQPQHKLQLRMHEFSAPLARLASHFIETWEFQQIGDATQVVPSFELHALSRPTLPILWLISCFLKPAIARHLRQMSG